MCCSCGGGEEETNPLSLLNEVLISSKTTFIKPLTTENIYALDVEDSIDSVILESYKGVYPIPEA